MLDEQDLIGLVGAYIAGDALARKVLLDALEETGDARAAAVREEDIDWDSLTEIMMSGKPLPPRRRRKKQPFSRGWTHMRWLIDCARLGSNTPPVVAEAVREARREWLEKLFPELTK
jgi:hypothetical protein